VKDFRKRAVWVGIVVASTAAVGTAPASAAAPGVLAQWNFDEPAGQVLRDSGPFGLDGTLGLSTSVELADPERIDGTAGGGALRFNGSSFVRLPDAAQLAPQALTVAATARADHSPGAYRYLVSRGGSECVAASYGLYTAPNGGLAFYVFDGTNFVLSPAARRGDVWDGQWHDLRGTFDGTSLRLFIDGRQVGEPIVAPVRINYSIPSHRALIGQYGGDCELGFAGDIDSVTLSSFADVPPGTPEILPPAEPGKTIPATDVKPGAPNGSPKPQAKPGCTVRLSRKSIRAGRPAVVRVSLQNAPRRSKLRLSAKRSASRKTLATARLTQAGSARLVLKPQRAGRLTVRVVGYSNCAAAQLRVIK
jgi:hypothetical protein